MKDEKSTLLTIGHVEKKLDGSENIQILKEFGEEKKCINSTLNSYKRQEGE